VSLALITKNLEARIEEEEKRSKRKSSKEHDKTLSSSHHCFEWNWDLKRFWFTLIVSCIECTSSCIECVGWKLGCLQVLVVGGIYSPNHQSDRWGRLLSKSAPEWPLGKAAVEERTGQSGAPPDTVWCASHMSHPVLEGKPNANHVRARISYSRTQQLHNMDIITQCSNSIKKGNNSRLHHMSETSI
jgi:hypothetical protein